MIRTIIRKRTGNHTRAIGPARPGRARSQKSRDTRGIDGAPAGGPRRIFPPALKFLYFALGPGDAPASCAQRCCQSRTRCSREKGTLRRGKVLFENSGVLSRTHKPSFRGGSVSIISRAVLHL